MKPEQKLAINRLPDEKPYSDDRIGSKIPSRKEKIAQVFNNFIRKTGKVLEDVNDILPPYFR